jgi:hypothetical protein
MAAGAPAGSRPTSGGNKRPDDVANQNAGKKNARQIESCCGDKLHLMGSCTAIGKLTNGLVPDISREGELFFKSALLSCLEPELYKPADGF